MLLTRSHDESGSYSSGRLQGISFSILNSHPPGAGASPVLQFRQPTLPGS